MKNFCTISGIMEKYNVSRRTVYRIIDRLRKVCPEAVTRSESGRIMIDTAAVCIVLSPEELRTGKPGNPFFRSSAFQKQNRWRRTNIHA